MVEMDDEGLARSFCGTSLPSQQKTINSGESCQAAVAKVRVARGKKKGPSGKEKC